MFNYCFIYLGKESDCETYNPSKRFSEWQKIKNWMIFSKCASAFQESPKFEHETGDDSCCGDFALRADNVDLLSLARAGCRQVMSQHNWGRRQPA